VCVGERGRKREEGGWVGVGGGGESVCENERESVCERVKEFVCV